MAQNDKMVSLKPIGINLLFLGVDKKFKTSAKRKTNDFLKCKNFNKLNSTSNKILTVDGFCNFKRICDNGG